MMVVRAISNCYYCWAFRDSSCANELWAPAVCLTEDDDGGEKRGRRHFQAQMNFRAKFRSLDRGGVFFVHSLAELSARKKNIQRQQLVQQFALARLELDWRIKLINQVASSRRAGGRMDSRCTGLVSRVWPRRLNCCPVVFSRAPQSDFSRVCCQLDWPARL